MSEPLAIGQNLPVIAWAIRHINEIDDILQALSAIGSAQGITAKSEAAITAQRLVVAIIADYPYLPDAWRSVEGSRLKATVHDEEALKLQLGGDGSRWQRLIESLPKIMEFIAQIVALFGK